MTLFSFQKRASAVIVIAKIAAALSAGQSIAAEIYLAKPPPILDFTIASDKQKLAPALRVAASNDGTFVGVTRSGMVAFESKSDPRASNQAGDFNFSLASSNEVVPVRHLIVFTASNPSLLNIANYKSIFVSEDRKYIVIESDNGFSADILNSLSSSDDIVFIEPDYPFFLSEQEPNDPEFTKDALWGLMDIHADTGWKMINPKTEIVISVLDTGIDMNHPDLKENLYVNEKEVPDNKIDEDLNNYVDDVNGVNFFNLSGNIQDQHGHGTHVAGIIAAIGNNSEGTVGVVWKARLLPLKLFGADGSFVGAERAGRAIDYAVGSGAKILNLSWDGPFFSLALKEAIDRADSAGVYIVAAAGNAPLTTENGLDIDVQGQERYPASFANENIVSVAALQKDQTIKASSNFGSESVDLTAPGDNILSTFLNGKYVTNGGTSMAAPYVSGAIALLMSGQEKSVVSKGNIKSIILGNSRKLESLRGKVSTESTLDLSFLKETPIKVGLFAGGDSNINKEDLADHRSDLHSHLNETITVRGMLSYPHFSIGNGTTGIILETREGVIELDPRLAKFERVVRALSKEKLSIKGVLEGLDGVNGRLIIRK